MSDKTIKLSCIRHPPIIVVIQYTAQGAAWQSQFPVVDKDWICGEYETKIAILRQ